MSIPEITLNGTFTDAAGDPMTGTLSFRLNAPLVDSVGNVVSERVEIVSTLNDEGQITDTDGSTVGLVLYCTSGGDIAPAGLVYDVKVEVGSRPHRVSVALPDSLGATVDWADLVPVPASTGVVWTVPDLTAEQARDLVGSTLVAGDGLTKTVDDPGDTVTLDIDTPYTTAEQTKLAGIEDGAQVNEVSAADLTTEATTRGDADAALDSRVDSLETTAAALPGTYVSVADDQEIDGQKTFNAVPLINAVSEVMDLNGRYFNIQDGEDATERIQAALDNPDIHTIEMTKIGDFGLSEALHVERGGVTIINRAGWDARWVIDGLNVYSLKRVPTDDTYLDFLRLVGLSIYDPDPVAHLGLEEGQGFAPNQFDQVWVEDCLFDNLGDESIDFINCRNAHSLRNVHRNAVSLSNHFFYDLQGRKTVYAVAAGLGLAGKGHSVEMQAGPSANKFTAIVYLNGVEVERYTDMASPAALVSAAAASTHVRFVNLNSVSVAPNNNPTAIAAQDLVTGDGAVAFNTSEYFESVDEKFENVGVANCIRVEVAGTPTGGHIVGRGQIVRPRVDGCAGDALALVAGSNGSIEDVTIYSPHIFACRGMPVSMSATGGSSIYRPSIQEILVIGGGEDADTGAGVHRGAINWGSGVVNGRIKGGLIKSWGVAAGHHGIRFRSGKVSDVTIIDAADCGVRDESTAAGSSISDMVLLQNGLRAASGTRTSLVAASPTKVKNIVSVGNFVDYVETAYAEAASFKFVRKTTTESVTSSAALQDDDELLFPIGVNETWLAEFVIFYDGATTGDIKFGLTVPAGCAYTLGETGLQAAATTTGSSVRMDATATTGALPSAWGAVGAGTMTVGYIRAVIRNGATAGNVVLQWAQSTSDGTATRVFADSYINARKVA